MLHDQSQYAVLASLGKHAGQASSYIQRRWYAVLLSR